MKLEITVGRELFKFDSFPQWVNTATRKFRKADETIYSTICIDAKGRVCNTGAQFKRADAEHAFPIKVYAIE